MKYNNQFARHPTDFQKGQAYSDTSSGDEAPSKKYNEKRHWNNVVVWQPNGSGCWSKSWDRIFVSVNHEKKLNSWGISVHISNRKGEEFGERICRWNLYKAQYFLHPNILVRTFSEIYSFSATLLWQILAVKFQKVTNNQYYWSTLCIPDNACKKMPIKGL